VLLVRRSLEFALDRESDQETEAKYESSSSPSPLPYNMLQQQQQQQQQQPQGKPSQMFAPHQPQPPPLTQEEQLLAMITTLQQQVSTMLLQQQGSQVEVARPQVFSGKMKEVSAFINAAHLYIRIKMTEDVRALRSLRGDRPLS